MKKYFFLLFLLGISIQTIAQEQELSPKKPGPNFFIRLDGEFGHILASDDFLRGNNATGEPINQVGGGNIEFGWRARGGNRYDPILKYPAFGFGLLSYGFPQTNQLGYPNAFYMFLNAPYKRWENFSINYIIRLGMSYNWEPNNPVENPANLVLGSYRNLYIAFGSEAEYRVTNRLNAALGFKFAHFSNGQSSLPNAGMNLITPHVGLTYNFNGGEKTEFPAVPKSEYTDKAMEYYFTIGNGIRQIFFDSLQTGVKYKLGVSYPVYNISLGAQYHYGWAGKFGGGIDLIYWGAYNPQIVPGPGGIVQPAKYDFGDYLQMGVFVSYEFVLNNVSIYAQPGYRVLRNEYEGMPPDFYQHLALKYHMRDLIIGVAIRAVNFGQAEYIEWNIGYRFRKSIKK